MAGIVLHQVTKRYPDGTEAVKRIDLDIADGELVILVGPSGCGKSTTLNMIAGLEDISDGELRIGDKLVNGMAPKDRDIAMVFQSYALYPHMTVRQNMAFSLKLAKTPKATIDQKVTEAAKALDLTDLLDHKPANLSGGQRQRVAMGRAVVRNPTVFLMDEPLSNLDAKLRVQMRAEIARLQKRLATTMVYVTHDQTEAMTLGDRVAVMRMGSIEQVGPPRELYDSPVNIFVAGFIGSPSMNFVPARVDGSVLRSEFGAVPVSDDLRQALQRPDVGKELILGVRPESFRDVANVSERDRSFGLTFEATVDVLESTGADAYAYFTLAGGPPKSAHLDELASDSGRADADTTNDQVVARLDSATQVKAGDVASLWVDVRPIHVFDATTGANLSLLRDAAAAPSAA